MLSARPGRSAGPQRMTRTKRKVYQNDPKRTLETNPTETVGSRFCTSLKKVFRLKPSKPILTHVNGYSGPKNCHPVLKLLRSICPNCSLLIAGNGAPLKGHEEHT